ncbi:hypothetical protein C7B61_10870 [filamentous cyanobacterium CCP1]|nr:hypothetical protein C7B76_17470 [filamentous cyanobacterium CCP2]PSB65870.1 hypothetical protein C7B61_10870 [filamentous cyanobacterium CCP1]
MPSSHYDCDFWHALEEATVLPQSVNFVRLCQLLDELFAQVPESQQLRVAGEAIEKLAELLTLRSFGFMSAWEEASIPDDEIPVIEAETLEAWVRQTMYVDLDAFIEQPQSKRQRKQQQLSGLSKSNSVVGEVDRTTLLDLVEKIDAEQASEQMLRELAGEECVSEWLTAIEQWLRQHKNEQPVSLNKLCQSLCMLLVEVWLGLLLGGYTLEQHGEFYHSEIWVIAK